jgi:LacI family transcriptional regulator
MTFKKQVTSKQVAEEAGVSPQTVSRVANNHPDVSDETRTRVQSVIDRLSYQPSLIARTLLQGHSRTLGVVGAGLELYGPSHVLYGIQKQADDLGYTLHLALIREPERGDVEQVWRDLLSQHVEGIIWAVPEMGNNRSWFERDNFAVSLPLVLLSMRHDPKLSVVAVNNRLGGEIATQHMIALGYRRIGIITGPSLWWEARQRSLGWEDALKKAGLRSEKRSMVEGDWTPQSGESGLRRLLEQSPDVEALFVGNDQMALGALRAARTLGRRTPEDLAIVGFDDIPESAYFEPALSTIRQDLVEMGRCAVQELCRVMEASERGEPFTPRTISIEPQLIIRRSSEAHTKIRGVKS